MRIVAVAGWLLLTTVVHAEPSRSIRYLMGESVSMFEWGVFRMETAAQTLRWDGVDIRDQSARVEYDWDKNRLTVNLTVYPRYQSLQKATVKETCGSLIRQMKFHFGVEPGSEYMREISGIATYFRHQQFAKSNAPETLDRDLESVTELRIDVMVSKSDQPPFRALQSCSSDLLKSEVRYFTTAPH